MKILNGSELASYIKERQAKQVRGLRQADNVFPKLAIVQNKTDPVTDTYLRLKQNYGADILVEVEVYKTTDDDLEDTIRNLNQDSDVHGIVVQLPLQDISKTDQVLAAVAPRKDVDGLGGESQFDPATPVAINWLLAGYNVALDNKSIVIVGSGRLVGAPLAHMWRKSGFDPKVLDDTVQDLATELRDADIIVTATGSPGLITSDMLHPGAVIVDAGTAVDSGVVRGDVASDVRQRNDLTITPEKGGVGPLTVCALFDNVIRAARETTSSQEQA